MHNTKINKVVAITLLVLLFINLIPTEALAHKAYFLQVMIDRNSMSYTLNVAEDNPSKEKKHIEAELGRFYGIENLSREYSDYNSEKFKKDKFMPFTFPGKEMKLEKSGKNDAGTNDRDRALVVGNTLVNNLNEALAIINNGERYNDVESLIAASEAIIDAEKNGSTTYNEVWNISVDGDFLHLNKGKEEYKFRAKMKKGYNNSNLEDGEKSLLYSPEYSGDVENITIGMLAIQANYTYKEKGHTLNDIDEYDKPDVITAKISEWIGDLINKLYSALGLYDLNELIYSKGVRGTNSFYGGIMTKDWMHKAMVFHMIFQALAWILLIIAIIKLLFQRNLATINPSMRISLISGIKDLLITGFMLISIFVLLNTLISLNAKIVDIFSTTTPGYSVFNSGAVGNHKTSAGIVMQLFYLFVSLYMNCVYIVRAIVVTILIAAAPIFILGFSFGEKGKKIFSTWSKELIGNIFLQSFHAFVLSIFLNIQISTRGIELAILSASLIPMTAFFKSLFLGESGGVVQQVGGQIASTTTSGVAGFAGGLFGSKKSKNNNYNDVNTSGPQSKDSSKIPGVSANPARKEHSVGSTISKKDSKNAINSMESSIVGKPKSEAFDDEADSGISDSTEFSNSTSGVNPYESLKKYGKISGKDIGKSLGGAVKDASKASVAGAALLAYGGTRGGARAGVRAGTSMGRNIKNATKQGVSAVGGATSLGMRKFNEFAGRDNGGNIIGVETMDNGDTVVHRDRKMVANDGLSNATRTADGNIALTYNKEALSSENASNLEKIETAARTKNYDYLYRRGIEEVSEDKDKNLVVHYNQHGLNHLGFKDIYQTENRVVETKAPGQGLNTNLTYDIDKVGKIPPNGNYDKNVRANPGRKLGMDEIQR